MPNKHCSYALCNSDSRRKDNPDNVYFIKFPNPHTCKEQCQRWINACGRSDFSASDIKRWTYICSKHFVGGRGPTEDHPDPISATPKNALVIFHLLVCTIIHPYFTGINRPYNHYLAPKHLPMLGCERLGGTSLPSG